MTTIVVVDDHQIMREGLCSLLNSQPDFQILGDTGDGEMSIKFVEKLQPDVLIVDMVMPGISGIEVTKRIKNNSHKCAVIILSMYGAEEYVREAIASGALGYVLKKDSVSELARAVREVAVGRYYISPNLTQLFMNSFVGINNNSYKTISNREREVLFLVASGNTSAQVASKMFLSRRTIEFHRANIMRKLGLRNQQELIRYCFESGIIYSKFTAH